MSDARNRALPEPVGDEVASDAERTALAEVWDRLDAARPARAVATDERAAMWAAIAAATRPQARDVAASPPVVAVPDSTAAAGAAARVPSRTAPRRSPPMPPAWARRGRRTAVGVMAAVIAVLLGVIGRPGAWEEVTVPRGRQEALRLPDGSRVALEGGSTLRFRRGFRGWFGRPTERVTELEGTGYFAVARDGRPFTVRTYNASVRVLGTAFNVQARRGDSTGTTVAVAEGRVELRGTTRSGVALAAGQRAVLAHGELGPGDVEALPVDRVAPWRTGGFVAIDEPLSVVLGSLERHFGAVITLEAPDRGDRRVTLYFPSAALERVLADLATMQELVLERRRDGYVLRSQ
jgi:ferric-dicitrate binding protein FerR (iron transport regulator)